MKTFNFEISFEKFIITRKVLYLGYFISYILLMSENKAITIVLKLLISSTLGRDVTINCEHEKTKLISPCLIYL